MTLGPPTDHEEDPFKKKIPARAPQVTITDGPHTYTILLTVNGTLWTGTYIP